MKVTGNSKEEPLAKVNMSEIQDHDQMSGRDFRCKVGQVEHPSFPSKGRRSVGERIVLAYIEIWRIYFHQGQGASSQKLRHLDGKRAQMYSP